MSLYIYKQSGGQIPVSQEETFTEPIICEFSETGGISEQRLYLRSDRPTLEKIIEGSMYAANPSESDGSDWITFAPDVNGAAGPYTASMNFELDFNEELPFWMRVEVPDAQIRGTKSDIDIVTDYLIVEA